MNTVAQLPTKPAPRDPRPCFTGLRMGSIVTVIRPGPLMTAYWADDKFKLSQAVDLAKLDYASANQ